MKTYKIIPKMRKRIERQSKASKKMPIFIWTIIGVLIIGGFAIATTTISDTQVTSTGSGNFSEINIINSSGTIGIIQNVNGGVGIGTINPLYNLEVNGTFAITGSQFIQLNNTYINFNTSRLSIAGADVPSGLNSKSNAGSVNFNTTVSTRIWYNLSNGAIINTSDFTVHLRVKIPENNQPTSGMFSCSESNSATTANGFEVQLGNSGILSLFMFGATLSDYNRYYISVMSAKYGGKIVDLVYVRNSTARNVTLYINGVVATPSVQSTGGTPVGWNGTINSNYCIVGAVTAGQIYPESIYQVRLFNRVLGQSEVSQLGEADIKFADQWGNLTSQTSGILTAGKRYRITNYVNGDDFRNVFGANITGYEFIANATTPAVWTQGSILNEIGVFFDPDLENADPSISTAVKDNSFNNYLGTAVGGVTQNRWIRQFNVLNQISIGNFFLVNNSILNYTGNSIYNQLTIRDNSRLYLGSTNSWGIFSNGTNGLWINREAGTGNISILNGNLGLGTKGNGAKLDVKGSINVSYNGNVTIGDTAFFNAQYITLNANTTAVPATAGTIYYDGGKGLMCRRNATGWGCW